MRQGAIFGVSWGHESRQEEVFRGTSGGGARPKLSGKKYFCFDFFVAC